MIGLCTLSNSFRCASSRRHRPAGFDAAEPLLGGADLAEEALDLAFELDAAGGEAMGPFDDLFDGRHRLVGHLLHGLSLRSGAGGVAGGELHAFSDLAGRPALLLDG